MVPCRRLALKVALVAQPVIAAVQMKRGRHVDSRLATAPANGPANGVNVLQKIQELHAEGDTVCFSVNEQNLYGGLSETVGIVNHALRFALQHDDMVEFVMPEIRPPIRRSADDYRFMFGEQEVCEPRWTNMYIATCPLSPADDCGLPVRCSINETVVYQNTVYLQSRCGPPCHEFVMVSSLVDPDFDYSVTGPLLSELYWRRRHQSKLGNSTASSELQFPITTVVHLSKGDATKANSSTGTTGLLENEQVDFNPIITALVDLVDPQCLKVELHTSAQLNSTFVQGVVTSWKNNNVNEVEVFDNSCQESEAFDRMASADILIGDASGFSRLAGVLGKASVSIFVDPELGDTRGVGGVFTHGKSGQAAVEPDLANISKVIDGCNAWLGK